MPKPRRDAWTAELDARVIHLRNIVKLKWRQIGAELDRSKTACQARYCKLIEPNARIKLFRRNGTEEAEAELLQHRKDGKTVAEIVPIMGRTLQAIQTRLERLKYGPRGKVHFDAPVKTKVPPSILADRDYRANLPTRSFGDPPVGYSALDKRERALA
jgi:hypothetical protein